MRANLVQTQPFGATFGKGATRKRPKLGVDSYAELLNVAESTEEVFSEKAAASAGLG